MLSTEKQVAPEKSRIHIALFQMYINYTNKLLLYKRDSVKQDLSMLNPKLSLFGPIKRRICQVIESVAQKIL